MIGILNSKNSNKVTDKIAAASPKVTDLTFKELAQASEIFWSSRVLTQLDTILDSLDEGYSLNKFELQAMETLIERYNTEYKSPLSSAMTESNEE